MIRLRVVRHGEPAWNVDGRGVNDPDLTSAGRDEVDVLRQELAGEHFDAFYVSPLRRALQTAEPLARTLGVRAQVCDWLAELGQPDFEGHPWASIDEAYVQAHAREPGAWWDGMPGGEPFRGFHRRVVDGVEALLAEEWGVSVREVDGYRLWSTPDETVSLLLVCHGGTAGVLLSHLLDLEVVPWVFERFPLRTGRSVELETRNLSVGEMWTLMRFEGAHPG